METTQQVAVITVPAQEWNETKALLKTISEKLARITDQEEKELLTPKEVCERLKIGRSTFQRYIANGELEPIKVSRKKYSKIYVRRAEIEQKLNEGKI